MKPITKGIAVLIVTIFGACTSNAQTVSFTWTGGAFKNYVEGAQFATIDNYQTNASIGFAGNVAIGCGAVDDCNSLSAIDLPNPGTCSIPRNPDGSCSGETFPTFPNDGKLATCSVITWGQNQWGTRADGTQMDGTKAGDYYHRLGSASCAEWNGSADVSLTELREMIQHQTCGRFGCGKPFLTDTLESGSGTATVQGTVTSKVTCWWDGKGADWQNIHCEPRPPYWIAEAVLTMDEIHARTEPKLVVPLCGSKRQPCPGFSGK